MKIKGLRRIVKLFRLFLINHVFVGTCCYGVKRKLMRRLGFSVGEGTRIVGPVFCTGQLEIGSNCWIGRDFSVNGNGKVVIGDYCDIAPDVSFLTGGHKIGTEQRRAGEGETYEIRVGNGCWLGARSTVLGNTVIGDGAVVAACGCVNRDVAPSVLVGGVPAKIIKALPIQNRRQMVSKLISCIIPMYNAQAYIKNCLESVLSQTYQYFEVIVVNDCSTDTSANIVEEFAKKDSRIRLLHHEKNQGVSVARNNGMEAVLGDFVCFLDADDSLPSDSFAVLMQDAEKYGADIVMGRDISYREYGKFPKESFSGEITIFRDDEAAVACLKDFPNTWNVCGKLFSRQILEGLFFCSGRGYSEDSFFFFQCCLRKPLLVYHEHCVYRVFMSRNSLTRSVITEKKIADVLYFADQKNSLVEQNLPQYCDLAINMKINACLVILNGLCKSGTAELKPYKKECIQFIRKNKKYYLTEHSNNLRMFRAVTYRVIWLYQILLRAKIRRYQNWMQK